MNKQLSDALRTVLKVGGAALATSGLLPAQCSIADPTLASSAGLLAAVIGIVWGQFSAADHQQLKAIVDNSPTPPPATGAPS